MSTPTTSPTYVYTCEDDSCPEAAPHFRSHEHFVAQAEPDEDDHFDYGGPLDVATELEAYYRPADPFLAGAYDRLVGQGVAPAQACAVVFDSF